ncbi:cyanophycin synthetase [Sphingobacterium sp.]|uniref:cyanophycin synthetase n=1 Tax=Sphingobacterium sp. TaxID=341027 RepID=UPI0028ABCEDF|nr:cyanophycin synthetase [Sphingobacterium sp.]
MNIEDIKVLKGPNRWSIKRTDLIQVTLDIQEYESLPSNQLEGFTERLFELIPSLYSHRCSEGRAGGFLQRMLDGTWMGHIMEHIALELQCLAGMECGFGRTRAEGRPGVYYVVFSYLFPKAGAFAAEAAVDLADRLARGLHFDLEPCLARLAQIGREERMGPSTQAIVDAATRRGIPWRRLDENSLVMLGHGIHQRRIRATMADSTSNIAVETVQDKHLAKKILMESYLPVPQGTVISNISGLEGAIAQLGYPVAIKPLDGNHGRGVSSHVVDLTSARKGFEKASSHSQEVIVEKHIRGEDYRLLVVGHKLVAAARRTPAHIIGNGRATVRELIVEQNSDPRRGKGHENFLTRIEVDHQTLAILEENGLEMDSVLALGTRLLLKYTANLSTGGTSEDVTRLVHPQTKSMAERASRIVGLDICGIDLVALDIELPLGGGNGAIIEVNAAPGLRMHTHPTKGDARDVGKDVVDMLFPAGVPFRVPIVAVTGTNGKTSTVRLLAHMAQVAGKKAGCTTTEGIYIDGQCITEGDCSGPISAGTVLSDPLVDYAVLECARGGILRAGLGFDRSMVSILTNIAEDHLGLDGIEDVEALAIVKRTVLETTQPDGLAIINADDPIACRLTAGLGCGVGYFGMVASPLLSEHFSKGGAVAYIDQGWLTLGWNGTLQKIAEVRKMPLTMGGKYDCMVQNCLAAALGARASGIPVGAIAVGLCTFNPDEKMNLGRMNTFQLGPNRIIVDYAHNSHGYRELAKYLSRVGPCRKTGIITGTGDRRDKDIAEIGSICAQIFDRLVLRTDRNCRGRRPKEIIELLLKGIRERDREMEVVIEIPEAMAIGRALDSLEEGELVFISSDDSRATLEIVKNEILKRKSGFRKYGT